MECLVQGFFVIMEEAGRVSESLCNPKEMLFLEKWSNTKHDSRTSCSADIGFTAFGIALQLIGGPQTYAET